MVRILDLWKVYPPKRCCFALADLKDWLHTYELHTEGGLSLASAMFPCALLPFFILKVVTDISPDYSDMATIIRSIIGRWKMPEQKC